MDLFCLYGRVAQQSITATAGSYAAHLTDAQVAMFNFGIANCTNISSLTENEKETPLDPNPFNNKLYINCGKQSIQKIELIDAYGKLACGKELSPSLKETINLDIAKFFQDFLTLG